MSNKVYTSYLANMKNIPSEAKKIVIMRAAPMSVKAVEDLIILKELAPTFDILNEYKLTGDINKLKNDYNIRIRENKECIDLINLAIETLDNDNPICFICCEKDRNSCHRSVLGDLFLELGYEVEEVRR